MVLVDTGQKRNGSPLDHVSKKPHHISHDSVMRTADLCVSSPVSSKPQTILTGKTLEMGTDIPPPDSTELFRLLTALTTRVSDLESKHRALEQLVEDKNKELSDVRSENASLQSQINCTGATENLVVQSSQSSENANLQRESSAAPIPPASPMVVVSHDESRSSGMAPLHPQCEAKAKKLFWGLNNTGYLPLTFNNPR